MSDGKTAKTRMSGKRETLVLHAAPEELRLTQLRGDGSFVELIDASAFLSGQTIGETLAFSDQTLLDALQSFVEERGWRGRDVFCLLVDLSSQVTVDISKFQRQVLELQQ